MGGSRYILPVLLSKSVPLFAVDVLMPPYNSVTAIVTIMILDTDDCASLNWIFFSSSLFTASPLLLYN
jgi:hypothetical protein